MAAFTASRALGLTEPPRSEMTRETVLFETPARRATSMMLMDGFILVSWERSQKKDSTTIQKAQAYFGNVPEKCASKPTTKGSDEGPIAPRPCVPPQGSPILS